MSNRKQKLGKARDRRTTRSWKIKSWSRHGVRCLLMHARVLLKPPRDIGKRSKINTSALWQSIPIGLHTHFGRFKGVGRISSLCAAVGQLAWSKYAMHLQVEPWNPTMWVCFAFVQVVHNHICIMRIDYITLFFTLCRTRLPNIDTKTCKLRKANSSN